MNNNLNPEKERLTKSESDYEKALRPSAFDGFAGQEQIKENFLTTMKLTIDDTESMGFSIPINVVKEFINKKTQPLS